VIVVDRRGHADRVRPGGFGRATFGASGAPVTAIPEAAIRYEADGLFVMTVDSNNRAHQVAVKVGQKGGGNGCSCDAGGCDDRQGNRYNRSGQLERYRSIDGKTCQPVGTTTVCR